MRFWAHRRSIGPRLRPQRALLTGALLLASMTLGCARYQYVNIRSEPPGASVFVDGEQRGRTPLRLQVDRTTDHIVFLKLEGHQPEQEILRLNQAPDDVDFLTPADVELRLGRRLGGDPGEPVGADPTRDVDVELEERERARTPEPKSDDSEAVPEPQPEPAAPDTP